MNDQFNLSKPNYPRFIVPSIIQFKEKTNEDISQNIQKSKIGVPKDGKKEYQRGISENLFCRYLVEWFQDQIYEGVGIYSYNVRTIFVPDFLFYNEATNFHLAIEIDEPYSYFGNKPTHWIPDDYSGNHWADLMELDDTFIRYDRNSFGIEDIYTRTDEFSKNGWFLMRFSEKQVIKQPHSCCKFILQKISKYINNKVTSINFNRFPDIDLDEMWTFEEAQQMAIEKYRDSYLPFYGLGSPFCNAHSYEDYYKKAEIYEQDILPF